MDEETIRKCAEVLAEAFGFDEPCNINDYDEYMYDYCEEYCKNICGNHNSIGCWEQFLMAKIKEKEQEQ